MPSEWNTTQNLEPFWGSGHCECRFLATEGTWQSPLIECLLIGAKLTSTYQPGIMKFLQRGEFVMPLQQGEN